MATRNIPPQLEPLIMKLHMRGLSAQEIVEVLARDHFVVASLSGVSRALTTSKTALKEVAKQTYAEAVARTAGSDVDIMNDTIEQLVVLKDEAFENRHIKGKVAECKAMAGEIKHFLTMRMGLSGVDRNDFPEDEENKSALLDRIDALHKGKGGESSN